MKVKIDGYVIDTDKIVAIHKSDMESQFTIVMACENNILIKRNCRDSGDIPGKRKRNYAQFEHEWEALSYGLEQDHNDINEMYVHLMKLWGVDIVKEEILDITV